MSSVRISTIGDNVQLFTLDMPDKSANVLTDQVYADLDEALKLIEANPPRGVVLMSAKPAIFVAGADLGKISRHLDWPDQEIFQFSRNGRAIMARFTEMPDTVSVAAIHGVCVGGGMELPLWCDYRIASDNPRTLLGLPEVKLGLIPGWAGTVRLPRLIGLQPATQMVTSGELYETKKCLELGIVSQVVSQEKLIDSALALIDAAHQTRDYSTTRRSLEGPVHSLPESIDRFRDTAMETILANTEIAPSAPTIALNHMIDSAGMNQEDACKSEEVAFARVWGSAGNRGLLNYFFLEERAKKTRACFDMDIPPEINTIGIVGTGLMGTQIARMALKAGIRLKLYDADESKSQNLFGELTADPRCQPGQVMAVSEMSEMADCDLVVEAIVEKPVIKQQIFERLSKIVAEQAFLATNTSTIPVRDIAGSVKNPERLVGLHFCCPVEPMRLVEIIRGEQTSDTTLNVAIDLVRRFRKTPIVVEDAPGFVVNRLLCPVFNEAIAMLQHHIAAERIDRVFREFGFGAGPLEMIDFIGVDTIMYAGETFLRTLPELVSLTPILPALVKRRRHGRKAGAGFYRYEHFSGPALADPEFQSIFEAYQKNPLELTDKDILDRLLDPMIAQARKVLQEGVVADSRDVDLCSILGTTFPRVRGGILYWADSLRNFQTKLESNGR